jgi:hypothetical protein
MMFEILHVFPQMLGQCPPGMMKHQSDLLIKGDFDGNERQFDVLPIEPSRSKQYVQHRYSIDSLTYLVKTVSVRILRPHKVFFNLAPD